VHGVAPTLEAQQGVEGGLFRAGLAAAVIGWTNQTYLMAELPFELGFMHMPFVDRRVHGVGANHWCINNASDLIQQAQQAALIQTTDYEVGQALVDLAATISAYDPAYYLDTLPEGDLGVITRIMLSRLAGMSDCDYCSEDVNMFNRAGFGRSGRFLQDTIRAELEKVLIGEKGVEQAMQDADAAIDAEIDRA
jgi:ABC-type glycerol-3-phosphate transport system substrate-binding protein